MAINTGVPTLLNPGFYFTLDASNANTAAPTNRVVILGSITTTATVNVPVLGTSVAEAKAMFGETSVLATMYERFRKTDLVNEVYLLPVAVIEGVPDIAAALAGLADMPVSLYVSPYSEHDDIAAFEAFLNEVSGRWSYVQQLFGIHLTARTGTAAALTTYAATENSKFSSVLGVNGSSDAVHLVAAAYGAACSLSLSADPELTLSDIKLDFAAPALASQFGFADRESLLNAGISTFVVADDGTVVLSRSVTLFTQDAYNNPNNAYRDTETMTGLAYVVQRLKAVYTTKLTRKKLVSDDAMVTGGSNFVTANTVLDLFIAEYRRLASEGHVQIADAVARAAKAEAAGGRVSIYLPINLANQLRSVAVVFSFSKS